MPPEAAVVFGDRLALASSYAALLATDGVERGLIGPREVPRLWSRHLLNCAALAPLIPDGARVVDIGSGAGLPGLVLAIVRPDLHVVLLEPMLRRTTFLEECVEALGLANVRVVRARAEQRGHGVAPAEVVTARAVARLAALLPLALPLVRPGGVLLAMKGTAAAEEVAEAEPVLRRWPGATAEVVTLAASGDPPTVVVRVRRGDGDGARERGRQR